MNYFMAVLQYLFSRKGAKKWLFFIVFSIVPAALIAYALPVSGLLTIIKETDPLPFGKLWLSFFDRPYILVALVAALLSETLTSACLSSAITYHLKIGKFELPRFFTSVNNNFFPCFSRTFIIGFAIVLSYTIFILFDSLWNIVLNSLGAIIASAFMFALILFLFGYAVSSLSLWLPTMIFTGRSFTVALATAFAQPKTTQHKFLFYYSFLVAFAMAFAVGAFYVRHPIVSWALTTFSYLIILIFAHVYWFIAFFGENKMPRADLAAGTYKRRV